MQFSRKPSIFVKVIEFYCRTGKPIDAKELLTPFGKEMLGVIENGIEVNN